MGLSIQATGQSHAILGHIGSVEEVIAARLNPDMTSRRYRADDFAIGFELATPKNLASIGEAIVVNGFCFANSTDASSSDYDKTIVGKEFTCGGLFVVPKEGKPTHQFRIDQTTPMIDFYNQIYQNLNHPLIFAGIFHFKDFHGTAIGKPPIDGHDIFTHKEEYYPNPDVHVKNTWGFVMGAMTNFKGHDKINQQLKTVLYKNPMDAKSSLIHHAHILLLKKQVHHFQEIVPSVVDRTLHLFIDGTSIFSGQGQIFTVGEVKDDLLKGQKP